MKKSNLLILILVILGVVGFFYLANKFGSGEKSVTSEKPIITCQNDQCFYTAHLHFHLNLVIDGKEQDLPYEKGDLQKSHTHAEKNTIHWHATLLVDKNTNQVTNYSSLKLKVVLDQMEINYQDKKVTVKVNGQEKSEGLDYVWKDGDKVEVNIQ